MILAKFRLDLPERDRSRDRCTQTVPATGDGDRRPLSDRRSLERRLAKPGETIVAGDSQVDRHHSFANQPVRQVARHVGFPLTGQKVPAGRLDRQADRSAQLAKALSFKAPSTGAAD